MPSKGITVDAAPIVTLVEQNNLRTVIVVINTHAAQALYVNDETPVTATESIPIAAGGNLVMEQANGWDTTKKWYVIGSGAATTGNIYEGYGVIPGGSTTPGVSPSPPPEYPQGPMGPFQVDP